MDTSVPAAGSDRPTGRAADQGFLAVGALLFVASAGATIYWAGSTMGGWAMPGTDSQGMLGTAMTSQTWLAAAASFMGMWVVMMAAMMLPSLAPTLLRYRSTLRQARQTNLAAPTALAGTGYFLAWAVFGAVAYVLAVALAAAQMQWMDLARWAPVATGAALLLAGGYQVSPWKSRRLACCREITTEAGVAPGGAWRYGLRLGLHCSLCCLGFMAVWLVTGIINLGIMALAAGAITLERLGPKPEWVARGLGLIIILAGVVVTAHAFGV